MVHDAMAAILRANEDLDHSNTR